MQALFGDRLSSDINLIAQLLILIGLWIGANFARHKQIARHQNIQTTLVLLNTYFILFVMFNSFNKYVLEAGVTTGPLATLMIVHGSIGLVAELTAIYLILRMRTNILPRALRVQNYKLVMRLLLVLWTVIVGLGLSVYFVQYLVS